MSNETFLFAAHRADVTASIRPRDDGAGMSTRIIELLRGCVVHAGGRELDLTVDSFASVFPSATAAAWCAVAMQSGVSDLARPATLSIGIHSGEPMSIPDGRFFGGAVWLAARLSGRAAGGQILASQTVGELLAPSAAPHYLPATAVELKGMREAVPTVEITWTAARADREPGVTSLRTRTFVTADQVGSTAIIEALGDGEARTIHTALMDVLREALEEHNGREAEYGGDGLTAEFTSTLHALDCAVSMQQAAERHRRRFPGHHELRIRIGVQAGDVVPGDRESAAAPIVRAGHLCALAAAGQIKVSEAVVAIAEPRKVHRFAATSGSGLAALAHGVGGITLDWAPHAALSSIPRSLTNEPLSGGAAKGADLSWLRERWSAAAANERQLVVLSGDDDAGLMSLTSAFVASLSTTTPPTVLFGHCKATPQRPYQPIDDAFAALIWTTSRADLRRQLSPYVASLRAAIPDLADRMLDFSHGADSNDATSPESMAAAVEALLAMASYETAVVLVLDDLQAASLSMLTTLRALMRSTSPLPALIIGIVRDVDRKRASILQALVGGGSSSTCVRHRNVSSVADLDPPPDDGRGSSGTESPSHRNHPTPVRSHNLPAQLTRFIGRDRELTNIRRALDDVRLVTCVGPGGVGKTRAALEIAASLVARSGRGVWFVELAPIADASLVPAAVAQALGVRDEPDRTVVDQLVSVLANDPAVVILDNCEHLVDACVQLADVLLRSCEHVRILATSRQPLGISGERVYRMAPLDVPAADQVVTASAQSTYDAIDLFVSRATMHHPGFVFDDTNAGVVASICRQIDGIPLAIELAASRLRTMSLDEVERRLDNRFRLLTGGSRTALPRHQTLRALVDWSYDLLTQSEQSLLQRLSVFAGGFDLAAIEALAHIYGEDGDDLIDVVVSLVDKSLAQFYMVDGAARYALTDTVREYSRERLQDTGADATLATHEAHARVYLALAQRADIHLTGREQLRWLKTLTAERDNWRATFGHLRGQTDGSTRALALATHLGRFWWLTASYREGIDIFSSLLGAHSRPTSEASLRASALIAYARLQRHGGDYPDALRSCEEALGIAQALNDDAMAATALTVSAALRATVGEFQAAITDAEAAVELAREVGSASGLAEALALRGLATSYTDHVAEAPDDLIEALQLCEAAGDRIQKATILNNLACVMLDLGANDEALMYAREGYALSLEIEAHSNLPYVLGTLATLSLLSSDANAAYRYSSDIIALLTRTGDRRIVANSILLLAMSAAGLGFPHRAAALHGAADACLVADAGYDPIEDGLRRHDRDELRDRLGAAGYDAAYAEGLKIDVSEVLSYDGPVDRLS